MAGNDDPFFSFNSLMAAVTITAVVGCVAAAFLAFGAATFFLTGDLATTGVAGAATSVVSVMVKNVLVDRYTVGKVNTGVLGMPATVAARNIY